MEKSIFAVKPQNQRSQQNNSWSQNVMMHFMIIQFGNEGSNELCWFNSIGCISSLFLVFVFHPPQLILLLVFSFPSFSSITHFVLEVAPGLPGVRVCARVLICMWMCVHLHISEWAMCSPEFLQKVCSESTSYFKVCWVCSAQMYLHLRWIVLSLSVNHHVCALLDIWIVSACLLPNSSLKLQQFWCEVCIRSPGMQTGFLKLLGVLCVSLYMEHCLIITLITNRLVFQKNFTIWKSIGSLSAFISRKMCSNSNLPAL